jgi:hypothetical protein
VCIIKLKLRNIVAETLAILDVSSNVFPFAHLWKHCYGNKFGFSGNKNVSYQVQTKIIVAETLFFRLPTLADLGTLAGNNVDF